MLKRFGYSADFANDGLEVLDALGRRAYDVILMDVQMPNMDGLAATREVRLRTQSAEIPFIIGLTANATDESRAACFAAGMNDYVSKPIIAAKLLSALENCEASMEKLKR